MGRGLYTTGLTDYVRARGVRSETRYASRDITMANAATKALTLTDSTIGKKVLMAVSGLVLFGFLIGHMLGNLQVFLGPTPYNEYAKFLHDNKTLLWGTRGVLLLAIVVHIVTAAQLWSRNNAATRANAPSRYKMKKEVTTSYAAKAMYLSGPIIFLYIVFHLAHFTLALVTPGYQHSPLDPNGIPNVFHNVVQSFRNPLLVGIYVVAQLLVGLHLYHGAWSLFQSLGINHRRYNETLRSAATALALAVVAGFLSVPFGVLFGLVG